MARLGNLPDQAGVAFRRPTENEEGAGDATLREQLQHRGGVGDDPRLMVVPPCGIDDVGEPRT